MKVISQVSVGYTVDPLWGFCSVFKIEWDERAPTWSIIVQPAEGCKSFLQKTQINSLDGVPRVGIR